MALDKFKRSLSKNVYMDIKHKILNNELIPSERLIEMSIAQELGVSRTPVREALKELEKEDLVENYPRKGYVVSKISIKSVRDLYEVRRILEPKAVEKIALNTSNEDLKELESTLEKMKDVLDNGKANEMATLLVEWNQNLLALIDNQIMKDILSSVNERLYRFANCILRSESNDNLLYNSVSGIYASIEKQDGKGAARKSGKFVDTVTNMLEEQSDYRMFKE